MRKYPFYQPWMGLKDVTSKQKIPHTNHEQVMKVVETLKSFSLFVAVAMISLLAVCC